MTNDQKKLLAALERAHFNSVQSRLETECFTQGYEIADPDEELARMATLNGWSN